MKVALYARVSTTDQHCEMQLADMRQYCESRGWEIEGEYVDTGWSGAKASRPQLDILMVAARKHRFGCVLVWKLDRFSRSIIHLTEQLHTLSSAGVRFIATSQSIDTDQANPTSRLLLNILMVIAEFERDLIRERVTAGVRSYSELYRQNRVGEGPGKRASRSGKNLPPHRPLAVFDRVKAVELHEAGSSLRAIAGQLGVSRATVGRLLLSQKPRENPGIGR